jgi:hypothetical protein
MYEEKPVIVFNARKYNGMLKSTLKEDPLIIQKKMRDEWERDFS